MKVQNMAVEPMKYGILLLSVLMTIKSTQAQNINITEKDALLSYITLHMGKQICSGIEFNIEAPGWWSIGLLKQHGPAYWNDHFDTAKGLVEIAAASPNFCLELKNAYGAEGVSSNLLPWAKSDFRSMIK